MPRSELVIMRARDLEPGQRVRFPLMRRGERARVAAVSENEHGVLTVETDLGAYVCDGADMIDVEEDTAEVGA